VRDVGALHTRLVPGFVTETKLEPDARVIKFSNGLVVRELILGIDDERRRPACSVVGGRATHHGASIQVLPAEDGRSMLRSITDLLPDELAATVLGMVRSALATIKQTVEAAASEQ